MAESKYTKIFWPVLVFLGVCLSAMIGVMVFAVVTANRMIGCDAHLTASANDIRLEAVSARLTFEEIIHGEEPIDTKGVLAHFTRAEAKIKALVAECKEATPPYAHIELGGIDEQASNVRQKLRAVSELTSQRLESAGENGTSDAVGQQYQAVFATFTDSAAGLERSMDFFVTQKARFFRSVAFFSIAMSALLAVLIMFVVAVHLHQRAAFARQQEDTLSQLSEKNSELEELIYEASQDMRAPLVNLQGFNAELGGSCREITGTLCDPSLPGAIKEKLSPVAMRDIPEALGHMRRNVERLNTLVNGLLRLVYMGRGARRAELVDINSIIGDIAEDARAEAGGGADISVEPLPDCRGDPDQLRQVFAALIDNAIKYLSPARPGRIRIYGRANHKKSVYAVEDNGKGISEKDQAMVFEAFKRVSPADSPPGEGLGLTVVRRLVHEHKGRIWLQSEIDKGTTFFVELPAG
jgi:signal transduction histidine kinase